MYADYYQLPNALSLWGEVGELLIQPLAIATQGADTWFVGDVVAGGVVELWALPYARSLSSIGGF